MPSRASSIHKDAQRQVIRLLQGHRMPWGSLSGTDRLACLSITCSATSLGTCDAHVEAGERGSPAVGIGMPLVHHVIALVDWPGFRLGYVAGVAR